MGQFTKNPTSDSVTTDQARNQILRSIPQSWQDEWGESLVNEAVEMVRAGGAIYTVLQRLETRERTADARRAPASAPAPRTAPATVSPRTEEG